MVLAGIFLFSQTSIAAEAGKTQLYLVSVGNGDPDNITFAGRQHHQGRGTALFCADRTRDKFPILLQGKEIHDPGFGIFAVYGKPRKRGRRAKASIMMKNKTQLRKFCKSSAGDSKQQNH
ncbi:MAG: hypothetical protein R2860_05620 [Desulfobacterales bacterium]